VSDIEKPPQATPSQDLEQQRAEIAQTVDALHAKLDVPTRSKAAVKAGAAQLNDNTALRNGLIAAAVAAVVLLIARRVRARRRS
jgi:Protein of unknown function (DUF3618)